MSFEISNGWELVSDNQNNVIYSQNSLVSEVKELHTQL